MASIFLGIPTYLDRIEHSGVMFAVLHATQEHTLGATATSAFACHGFNQLWLQALEARAQGFTHFCMLHSDVVPEDGFIDKLMSIMSITRADVLSVVIPIKDEKGLTSTALDEPVGDWDPKWRKRRLAMKEVFDLEATFTHPRLLVNTGLMLVDITKPWVEKIHFHFDDAIIEHHGKRVAVFSPEDWNFSMDARAVGASLFATRAVRVQHAGKSNFSNDSAWGTWETDRAYGATPGETPELRAALDRMESIEGWFSRDEGRLLYESAQKVLHDRPVVEVGSFKGRSTSVLAAARASATAKVFAIDPHEGNINLGYKLPSLFDFKINIEALPNVVAIVQASHDVEWREPIGMLFIDGMHDRDSVARDYAHFEKWLERGSLVAFHDYEPNYPGVMLVVDALVASEQLARVAQAGSLFVAVRT